MEKQHIWFKRKSYGWGWYPSCLSGWMAILGFFIAMILSATIISNQTLNDTSFVMIFMPTVFILVLILFILCLLKGEKPCWCWGGKPCRNCSKK
jgi:hypothetical protein